MPAPTSISNGGLDVLPAWARELYELFAPVRKSLEGYGEEEINEGVEQALREVRAEKG